MFSNPNYNCPYFYRYSILPYWNEDHDDALALLEREMARATGDEMSLNSDDEQNSADDSSNVDENENDSSPLSVDYMEGAEVPDKQNTLRRDSKRKNMGEEIMPSNIMYTQPHRIQKLPNELSPGQMDNFERPYVQSRLDINPASPQNTYATGKVIIISMSLLIFPWHNVRIESH